MRFKSWTTIPYRVRTERDRSARTFRILAISTIARASPTSMCGALAVAVAITGGEGRLLFRPNAIVGEVDLPGTGL